MGNEPPAWCTKMTRRSGFWALCGQENMTRSEVKEGKIELKAACDVCFRWISRRLIAVNSIEDIMIATRKGNTAVKKGGTSWQEWR